ncbi:hypothetical protein [Salinarimonas soli]|uniref:Uncharacterized protein n=1 Tax=Salinarimonas soli TaxID=1638099 RepID=A0A5B2VHA4_9HYPH|nr:hypothetical protein [Salinarimonas soli]KAA2237732.1 hypothetical protein F0L46_08635 [Salinarimonas soli]
MSNPQLDPFNFLPAITDAAAALKDEVDPYLLLKAAARIHTSAPNLSLMLQSKARRAFIVRWMLCQAVGGDLTTEV